MLTITVRLTGVDKMMSLSKNVRQAIELGLQYGIENIIKPNVLKFTPTPQNEEKILSRGRITISSRNTPVEEAGIGGPGRFMKSPEFKSLFTAISEEHPTKPYGTTNSIFVFWGHKPTLNQKIGFAWLKQTGPYSLERRTTHDIVAMTEWKNLIDIWEDGGIWRIHGRGGNELHPEDGKYALEMEKEIKPHRMFFNGVKMSEETMVKFIELLYNQLQGQMP